MPVVSSAHFLLGPVVALAALAIIALLCRWVFSTEQRDEREAARLEKAFASRDYGLLVPLTAVRTEEDAQMLRAVLLEAGIRSNLTPELELLVFSKDLVRARSLVSAR
jgi:hypothetical protein